MSGIVHFKKCVFAFIAISEKETLYVQVAKEQFRIPKQEKQESQQIPYPNKTLIFKHLKQHSIINKG